MNRGIMKSARMPKSKGPELFSNNPWPICHSMQHNSACLCQDANISFSSSLHFASGQPLHKGKVLSVRIPVAVPSSAQLLRPRAVNKIGRALLCCMGLISVSHGKLKCLYPVKN
jgi:hypothetical protein